MPLNIKKDEMGEVISDFYKSDAPQFRGKSKAKRREMAIAAKLNANEEHTYKHREKILKKTKKFHNSLFKDLHKKHIDGDVNEAVYGGTDAVEKKKKLDIAKKRLPLGRGFQGRYDQFGREYDTSTGKLKEALRSSILTDPKAMKKIEDSDRINKEKDLRMKYGKKWSKFKTDVIDAKDRLRPGEVKKYDKNLNKWVSNKDE